MENAIQVVTTTDSRPAAERIARELVENRLAACVQIQGPVASIYRWHGTIETAEEWTCTIKTVERLYAAVEARIRELHHYEEPEIVVTTLTGGSETYLAWLRAQLQAPGLEN
ncbi:MAG: divalent-cation tolerance protein CutA [Pirellulaceae bacterium]